MNSSIVRNVEVDITPTVSEIAKLIWDMDADEQSFLLYLLAKKFNNSHGYMQMLYVSESVVKSTYDLEVGLLIDRLQEYLGSDVLREVTADE